MARILILDTEPTSIASLKKEIGAMGHQADASSTLAEGLRLAADRTYDVIFLNASMPDGSGIDGLPPILATPSHPEVIIFADAGDADQAEQAIRMGAWDYMERPSTVRPMTLSLVRALQYRTKKIPRHPHAVLKQETLNDIVGSSPLMQQSLERLALSAGSDANVLISGETGTGKELFAWAIHHNSRRSAKRFVVVDCAALPETLVESTLFGFERGAFTGAEKSQSGLVKRADGGTLFLDEIGELPLSVQKSFLRVLQERTFRQVGGGPEIRSDFRLIAATNRDLSAMVQHHRFRKDLLFRLRAFTLELPPLRNHMEDLTEIAAHHLDHLCESYGLPAKIFSPDFFDVLSRYQWPGNVRELVNALERAVAAAGHEPVIFPRHMPVYIRVHLARASVEQSGAASVTPMLNPDNATTLPSLVDLRQAAMDELEQRYLKELSTVSTTLAKACAISGLSRSRLYSLLKRHRIRPWFKSPA